MLSSSFPSSLTPAGVLLGLVTFDGQINPVDHRVAYALIGLGLFGLVWGAKHHGRYDYFT